MKLRKAAFQKAGQHSFAAAQVAPPGVYITMNGRVFAADAVVKDRAVGAFVARG